MGGRFGLFPPTLEAVTLRPQRDERSRSPNPGRVLVAIGLLGLIVVTSFMVLATLLLVFVATMNAVS